MTRANNKRSVTFSKKNDIQSSSHENSKSNNGYYLPPVGKPLKPSPSMATLSRLERQNILLWKRPLLTLNYSIRELLLVLYESFCKLTRNKLLLVGLCLLSFCIYCLHTIHGPHTPIFDVLERKASWWIYWIFLGILSSVGLGTGLHTFLLYLGPHIAAVTLAAYECQTLRFPEPPYPNQILCPGDGVESTNYNNGKFFSNHSNNGNYTASSFGESSSSATDDLFDATIGTLAASSMISLWAIMSKVRVEAFMWGAGTALGELPPYFMARAARLSGEDPDDEEYREFQEFLRQTEEQHGDGWMVKLKQQMQKLIEGVGFFGILLFASIPNPLFDLAGLFCGHCLVPFWKFFGATLLGKAVIKMHLQKLLVIVSFSEHHVERCISVLKNLPKVGPLLQKPLKEWLVQQKEKLHRPVGAGAASQTPHRQSLVQILFEYFVVCFVAFFVVSLINSLAQNYHKRLFQRQKKKL